MGARGMAVSLGLSTLLLSTLVSSYPIDKTNIVPTTEDNIVERDSKVTAQFVAHSDGTTKGSNPENIQCENHGFGYSIIDGKCVHPAVFWSTDHNTKRDYQGEDLNSLGFHLGSDTSKRYAPRGTDSLEDLTESPWERASQPQERDIPGDLPGTTYVVNADGSTEGENPDGIYCDNPGWGYAIINGQCTYPMPIYVFQRPNTKRELDLPFNNPPPEPLIPEFDEMTNLRKKSDEHDKRQFDSPFTTPPRSAKALISAIDSEELSQHQKRQFDSPFTTPPTIAKVSMSGEESKELPQNEKRQFDSPFTTPPNEKRQFDSPFITPPRVSSPQVEVDVEQSYDVQKRAQESQQEAEHNAQGQEICLPFPSQVCGESEGVHDDYRQTPRSPVLLPEIDEEQLGKREEEQPGEDPEQLPIHDVSSPVLTERGNEPREGGPIAEREYCIPLLGSSDSTPQPEGLHDDYRQAAP